MPIFAYMIAEGCRYTRSKSRYLGMMAAVALVCQIVFFAFQDSLYQCILVTFSLSVCLIYALERAMRKKDIFSCLLATAAFAGAVFICQILPGLLRDTDFAIDYNIWGVLLPVLFYLGRTKWEKLLFGAVGLILLALDRPIVQWYALAALPLLALYNGRRGKWPLKYLFYLYYPLHLAILYGIKLLISYML